MILNANSDSMSLPVFRDDGDGLYSRPRLGRTQVLARIEEKLVARGTTLAEEILSRDLYFRVSLVGHCNLHCAFCHNEGGPTTGRAQLPFVARAMAIAASVGFRRIQFTGGEPLLHKQIGEFVKTASELVPDVGVTTNGMLLLDRLPGLITAGVRRVHVSLQAESLASQVNASWQIPYWLEPALGVASEGKFLLRLNLPVAGNNLHLANEFLQTLAGFGCDVKVFAILPEGEARLTNYPLAELTAMVAAENTRRRAAGLRGEVFLRDFSSPTGLRCPTCPDKGRCKEQSHSLRLGVDRILRPCLATRQWDSELSDLENTDQIRASALLALDFAWS